MCFHLVLITAAIRQKQFTEVFSIAGVKTQFPVFFMFVNPFFKKMKVSEIGLHSEFGGRWEQGKAWLKRGNSFLGTRLRKKIDNFVFLRNVTNFLFKLIWWPSLKSRNLISCNKRTYSSGMWHLPLTCLQGEGEQKYQFPLLPSGLGEVSCTQCCCSCLCHGRPGEDRGKPAFLLPFLVM